MTPVVETIATRLADRGHESVVYTTDTAGPGGRIKTDSIPVTRDGVTVHYFWNLSNQLAHNIPLPIPLGFRKQINRHVADFDAIHIHGYPHLLAAFTSRAARSQSVPYVLSPHGSVNLPDGISEGWLRKFFEQSVGQSILANADTLIALTDDEKKRLYEAVSKINTVRTIPNGIDPDSVVVSQQEVAQFREKNGFSDDERLATFVGRLTYKKGIDLIWKVANRLNGETFDGRTVRFVFVGINDGMRSKLEEYVSSHSLDNISILGYLPEREKNAALCAGDVFILPSYSEGQPISVLEACAAKTPVIISRQCSVPAVDQYDAGRIINPTSAELAEALEDLMSDPEKRNRCARNARRMVQEQFKWEYVVDELVKLYRSL